MGQEGSEVHARQRALLSRKVGTSPLESVRRFTAVNSLDAPVLTSQPGSPDAVEPRLEAQSPLDGGRPRVLDPTMSEPPVEPPAEPPAEPRPKPGPRWRRYGLGCGGLVLLGLFAAIAIPNFLHFGAKSKVSEVKQNLHQLYVAERSFQEVHDRFSEDLAEIGFSPERGNRYAYFAGVGGKVARRDTATEASLEPGTSVIGVDRYKHATQQALERFDRTGCPLTVATAPDGSRAGLGVSGSGPGQVFIGAAAGNLDADARLDCWSIATVDRVADDGALIPAGQPHCEQPDVGR